MRYMMKYFITGITIVLLSSNLSSQNENQKKIIDMEKSVENVLGAEETTVKKFNPANLKPNQIAIRVEHEKLNLSEKDLKKYESLSRNIVARIDYVTARCKNDVYYATMAVDKQRIEALYYFNDSFFTNRKIQWGKIVQTACNFDYEAQDWWYGFVLTLKSVTDGKGHFIIDRIKKALEEEYLEGDILEKILKFNDGSIKPPSTFSKGHVTKFAESMDLTAKTKNGYIISFPSKSPIPTPVICNDKLFVSGGFQSVQYFAFDPENGHMIWGVNLSDNGPSSAVCHRGKIIFNTESCTIFIIDIENGEHLWSYFLGDPLISTPAASQDSVFAVYPAYAFISAKGPLAPSHVLAAFELDTGKIKWQKWIDSDIIAAPVVDGPFVYVTSHSGIIYKFHASDGKIEGAFRARATSTVYPSLQGLFFSRRSDSKSDVVVLESLALYDKNLEKKYVSPGNKASYLFYKDQDETAFASKGVSLDQGNGFHGGAPQSAHAEAAYIHLGRKSVSTLQAYEGGRVLVFGGKVYGVFGSTMKAFDILTKTEIWSIELPVNKTDEGGSSVSAPSVAGDSLFVSTIDGKIFRVDVKNGTVLNIYETGEPMRLQPLLYKGKIFAPTITGKLVVIDTEDDSVDGYTSWLQ